MKDELKGKTVVVSVFSRMFRNADREESLEWTVAGQTISAGIIPQPIPGSKKFTGAEKECVDDIVESFREANPKGIELRFPAVEVSREKASFSRKQKVAEPGVAAFKAATARMTLFSIAE
ncbi:hypothetical protein A2662_01765 [Candidatus Giovannonibacteria bacterium RIFCSPHIGHO2_01_FULL_45_33]|uniref:Uncharacterized protein n=1 Tax=Candidatus Giovannonibacteria bacterium RIFCSPLOWO2_01_FULL_45_34 TaxID=1798351 RepID=A0A1F5WYW3_9BACT|nr:MAG: hypothetical protein A2662_01765 [Candidatus Giovannonibacteria bacterium RIFCSPHIGHO2_01_FULL_45_33]OGF71008.1 MAG: hypothetical protein A3C73_04280 [Candidatus Giovannonibacteria bacterium RIFCSPHIGHO2_02_FULL_44_11]OGF80793.1 MAG: hypothetical protein A2930_01530 [Candidatus Giovannonibacteria bacterium RIFCSPLOWO2_01_FULL_45_34]